MKIIREKVGVFDTFEAAEAERLEWEKEKPREIKAGRRTVQIKRVGPEGSMYAVIVNRSAGGRPLVDPATLVDQDAAAKPAAKKRLKAKERRAAAKKKKR